MKTSSRLLPRVLIICFLLLAVCPSHAYAGLDPSWPNITRNLTSGVKSFVGDLLTVNRSWLASWVVSVVLILSLFQMANWVKLINSGRVREPASAFARLMINCFIIGAMATPVTMSNGKSGSVMFCLLTAIDTLSANMVTATSNIVSSMTKTPTTQDSAQRVMDLLAKSDAKSLDDRKNFFATIEPAVYGVEWDAAIKDTAGNEEFQTYYSQGKFVPVKTKTGKVYVGVAAPSPGGTAALPPYTDGNVLDASKAAGTPAAAYIEGDHLVGQPATFGSNIFLLGKPLELVQNDLFRKYINNQMTDFPADLKTAIDKKLADLNGGSVPSTISPNEKADLNAYTAKSAIISWTQSHDNTRVASDAYAQAVQPQSGGGGGGLFGLDIVGKLKKLIFEILNFIAQITMAFIIIATQILFWVQAPFVFMSLPLLLATSDGLRNAFWNQIKNLVILATLPAITNILNVVLWGCLVQPILNALGYTIALSAAGSVATMNPGMVFAATGNSVSVVVLIMFLYPFILIVGTWAVTKSIFTGQGAAGDILKAGVTAAGAGLAVATGVGIGALAGGAAASAAGTSKLAGALRGGLGAAGQGALEAAGQAMGMQAGPSLAAAKEAWNGMKSPSAKGTKRTQAPPSPALGINGGTNGAQAQATSSDSGPASNSGPGGNGSGPNGPNGPRNRPSRGPSAPPANATSPSSTAGFETLGASLSAAGRETATNPTSMLSGRGRGITPAHSSSNAAEPALVMAGDSEPAAASESATAVPTSPVAQGPISGIPPQSGEPSTRQPEAPSATAAITGNAQASGEVGTASPGQSSHQQVAASSISGGLGVLGSQAMVALDDSPESSGQRPVNPGRRNPRPISAPHTALPSNDIDSSAAVSGDTDGATAQLPATPRNSAISEDNSAQGESSGGGSQAPAAGPSQSTNIQVTTSGGASSSGGASNAGSTSLQTSVQTSTTNAGAAVANSVSSLASQMGPMVNISTEVNRAVRASHDAEDSAWKSKKAAKQAPPLPPPPETL